MKNFSLVLHSVFCLIFLPVFLFLVMLREPGYGQISGESLDISALEDRDGSSMTPEPSIPEAGSTAVSNSVSENSPERVSTVDSENSVGERESGSVQGAGSDSGHTTLWTLIKAGGWIGGIIFALSLVACSVMIQFCLQVRRRILVPEDLKREVRLFLERGRFQQAAQICERDNSVFARILTGGLKEIDGGWTAVEKGLEDQLTSETAGLHRRIEYLSVIGNIAPMLGLLGTVIGMVLAFGELAVSDGSGRNLAQGIYFALVTTVDGLLVAIPVLAVYAILNNRIDVLVDYVTAETEAVIQPLKRKLIHFDRTGTTVSGVGDSSAMYTGLVPVGRHRVTGDYEANGNGRSQTAPQQTAGEPVSELKNQPSENTGRPVLKPRRPE